MSLSDFIKKRKYLIWWTKDYDKLDAESVLEAVLNYGNWDDVQTLFGIIGLKKAAEIFHRQSQKSKMGRQNYRSEAKNYFTMYFERYA